jgi:hypothetical protein
MSSKGWLMHIRLLHRYPFTNRQAKVISRTSIENNEIDLAI